MKNMKKLGIILALVLIFTSVFAAPISANENEYTVQKGDVLWKIAEKYGVTWQQLADYNGLQNPNLILPGQKIKIPNNKDENDKMTLTVLGTSDMHGAVNSWSYESAVDYGNIGFVKVYSVVKEVEKENPNTLVIDNGDTLQGSILTDDLYNSDLSKPNPMVDMMNFIGYDAMALGNHEFNFGLDLVRKVEKEAEFPLLSANIYNKADDSHLVKPYVIKEVNGVKVGILGLTVPSIPRWDGPKVESLKFKHMGEEAKIYAKALMEQGVDVIIASVHAGLESRHEDDGSDAAKYVAEYAPEIDIMLTGHDHSRVNEVINGVLVGAPVAKYGQCNEVVRFDIELEKQGDKWEVVNKKADFLALSDYEVLPEAEARAKIYHEATLDFLKETIGVATDDFHPAPEISGIPEAQIRDTAVIDLINDVQLKYTGADVAAAALFKSNSNLPKGNLNFANVFDIYKYANKLVAVEVTGKELKDYMEWSAAYFNTYKPGDVTISFNPDIRGYNYDMFAGVEYKIDISKPAGQRIVDLTMNGKPVEDDQIIKLAINDYRYSGLLSMGIISNDAYFNSDPITLRSYIKDYIQEKGTITPEVDNNWSITGIDLNHPLRDYIIQMVKDGKIEIPTSADGRTPNVKALNVYELIEEGKIPQEKLDELGIGKVTPIKIVHTNDTHSRVKEGKYDGMGFAKIATKVKDVRENNKNVLVLDAGDTFHGQTIATLVEGESIVDVMNAIGYDAMVPGNHDFNYGQERLVELSEMTNFPILSANVIKEDGTSLLDEYIIKDIDGVKVGIFGLATPETTYKTHPNNVTGLTFEDPVEIAKAMVEELSGKVDVIIALSHLGLDEASTDTSEKVAKEVSGIDIIIDGHSHTTLPGGKWVNGTLIVQAGEYDKNLGLVDLYVQDGEVVYLNASLLTKSEAAELEEDADLLKVVEEIEKENEKITSVVVGSTDILLDGERQNVRTGETNLGNMIADAMLNASGADVAFTNGGGIRASIEPGDITKGDVITVLPFGNYVVVKEIKGADLVAAIEHGISDYPETKGAFPHIAGMTVVFDPSKEAGSRVVEVKIGGVDLDPNKTYKLATNDFLAAGGDGYEMFSDGEIILELPGLDEVLIEYINEFGTSGAKEDGRIITVDEIGLNIFYLPIAA